MKPQEIKVGSLCSSVYPHQYMILISKSKIGETFMLKWLLLDENRVFVSRYFKHQRIALTLIGELDV
jgi:hypothetical protein